MTVSKFGVTCHPPNTYRRSEGRGAPDAVPLAGDLVAERLCETAAAGKWPIERGPPSGGGHGGRRALRPREFIMRRGCSPPVAVHHRLLARSLRTLSRHVRPQRRRGGLRLGRRAVSCGR